jgi:hypothetical protein
VRLKWNPELKHHCPDTPRVLVGLKTDLREDEGVLSALREAQQTPISVEAANAFATKIGAVTYVECSALTQKGLKEVFDTATRAARDSINAATGAAAVGGASGAGGAQATSPGGASGAAGATSGGDANKTAKKPKKKGGCLLL